VGPERNRASIVRILDATRHRRDGEALAARVSRHLGVPVTIEHWTPDLDGAYDSGRKQYSAAALVEQVARTARASTDKPSGTTTKWIGIVDVDLFIPVLTFVFGQAQLGGTAGIVSTLRLTNEFYGMSRDEVRLEERLEKELVHEIGHLFGLVHCRQFECVMRSSTYVEEIDLKRAELCDSCRAAPR
jgi:archaemetzincin